MYNHAQRARIFGSNLRWLLAEKGWNQNDLARAMWTGRYWATRPDGKFCEQPVHKDLVSHWACGKGLPDDENAAKLVKTLGTTSKALFGGDVSPEPVKTQSHFLRIEGDLSGIVRIELGGAVFGKTAMQIAGLFAGTLR